MVSGGVHTCCADFDHTAISVLLSGVGKKEKRKTEEERCDMLCSTGIGMSLEWCQVVHTCDMHVTFEKEQKTHPLLLISYTNPLFTMA